MSKHTPGPWTMEPFVDGCYDVNSPDTGDLVAHEIASEADARLIAAAPDLLEALRMVLNVSEGGFMSEKLAAEDVACKARERATGGER